MNGGAGALRGSALALPSPLRALLRAVLLALFAYAIFGPLLNLFLWAFAERWYFPSKLPLEYGLTFWYRVFQPRGNALASLGTSVWIAVLTVFLSLAVAVPAGYALARLKLPWRSAILLAFLLPQAVPNLPVYVNIAQVFYQIGLNGTILGVVLVHASHGLVLAVWIASAAFASVDISLEEAARNLGARRLRVLVDIVLPQVRGTLLVGLVLSFVTMLSVLSVPLMINPNSPTMVTVDVAYRINTFADYAVANALCLLSLLLAAGGAWFYLRHAARKVEAAA